MMVPWLIPTLQQLTVSSGLRGHAFLLLGVEGLGQEALVHAVAAQWLGTEKPEDHADYCAITCLEGKRDISVDQIRDMTQWAQQTAHANAGRLIVIWQAEKMNVAAANSLLKTLEEPPAGVRFLLTASRAGRLLPTILSRCQKVVLPVPQIEQAQQWLSAQVRKVTLEDIVLALTLHHGAPLAALHWLNSEALANWRSWQSLWQQCQQRQQLTHELTEWARKDVERFCQHLAGQCYVEGRVSLALPAWQLLRLVWQVQRGIQQNLSKDMLVDNLLQAVSQYMQGMIPTMIMTNRRGALA